MTNENKNYLSLNPCSNGIWSLTRLHVDLYSGTTVSLNPCSNGIWSLTHIETKRAVRFDSLNPCSNGIWSLTLLEKQVDFGYWES